MATWFVVREGMTVVNEMAQRSVTAAGKGPSTIQLVSRYLIQKIYIPPTIWAFWSTVFMAVLRLLISWGRFLRTPSKNALRMGYGVLAKLPVETIAQGFAKQVHSIPQQLAVIDHTGISITYERLDNLSALLADFLRKNDVRGGSRVVLLAQRSVAHIVAIIAVLRAGATYVPLDGDTIPDSMLESVIRDCEPAFVLLSRGCIDRKSALQCGYACVEDVLDSLISSEYSSSLQGRVDLAVQPTDCAYIIYTSGENCLVGQLNTCESFP